MSAVFALAMLIAAAPATPSGHDMAAGSPHAAPVDPQCPPEHAAMGHCKPAAPAPAPVPSPSAKPACSPEHAAMGHCEMAPAPAPSPTAPSGYGGPEHAADTVWDPAEMGRARRALYAEHGGFSGSRVLLDRFEYRAGTGRDGFAWEGDAWFGGDYDRLWLKSEGEGAFGKRLEHGEAQALFSRAIGPWFNAQAGIRQDFGQGPDRMHLALGVQGLAPYWFEIDGAVFLSTKGDLTARLEAEYDQRLTNQLILQPRLELNLAAQDVRELGVGAGLSEVEAGLRLRYEFVPEFAPYLGVEYTRATGRTARLRRGAGEGEGGWSFVTGLRAWF